MIHVVVFPSLSLITQFNDSYLSSPRWKSFLPRQCQTDAVATCTKDTSQVNLSICTGGGKSWVIRKLLDDYDNLYYSATEGTLPSVARLDADQSLVLDPEENTVILTTYISASIVYDILGGAGCDAGSGYTVTVIHDEAHHIYSPMYKIAYDSALDGGVISKTINFSATLPEDYPADYTYPLLRGIRDGVVRDFHITAMMCVSDDSEASFVEIVEMARASFAKQGQCLRMLVYTSEANTENEVESEGGTSVMTPGCRVTIGPRWMPSHPAVA